MHSLTLVLVIFFGSVSSDNSNIVKINNVVKSKQMGHQTKKLLHSKRNYQQNEKAAYRMGEDICK